MAREAFDREQVPVWDLFVRVFHWMMVALVATAFLSPDKKSLHEPVGYAVLGLVLARLAWGIIGTRHARFSDFVARPATVLAYLKALRRGAAQRYLGHNPAGGAMILALLGTLVIVTVSGWLSETDRFFGVDWVSLLHHVSAHLLLLLIGGHLLGVIVSSVLHGENLVVAMITGRKSVRLEGEHESGTAARSFGGAD
jgi:cytochrome b